MVGSLSTCRRRRNWISRQTRPRTTATRQQTSRSTFSPKTLMQWTCQQVITTYQMLLILLPVLPLSLLKDSPSSCNLHIDLVISLSACLPPMLSPSSPSWYSVHSISGLSRTSQADSSLGSGGGATMTKKAIKSGSLKALIRSSNPTR